MSNERRSQIQEKTQGEESFEAYRQDMGTGGGLLGSPPPFSSIPNVVLLCGNTHALSKAYINHVRLFTLGGFVILTVGVPRVGCGDNDFDEVTMLQLLVLDEQKLDMADSLFVLDTDYSGDRYAQEHTADLISRAISLGKNVVFASGVYGENKRTIQEKATQG